MENQLINAVGFDFMIEHPYNHSTDIFNYLGEQGEARESFPLRVPCLHQLDDCGFTPSTYICKKFFGRHGWKSVESVSISSTPLHENVPLQQFAYPHGERVEKNTSRRNLLHSTFHSTACMQALSARLEMPSRPEGVCLECALRSKRARRRVRNTGHSKRCGAWKSRARDVSRSVLILPRLPLQPDPW